VLPRLVRTLRRVADALEGPPVPYEVESRWGRGVPTVDVSTYVRPLGTHDYAAHDPGGGSYDVPLEDCRLLHVEDEDDEATLVEWGRWRAAHQAHCPRCGLKLEPARGDVHYVGGRPCLPVQPPVPRSRLRSR